MKFFKKRDGTGKVHIEGRFSLREIYYWRSECAPGFLMRKQDYEEIANPPREDICKRCLQALTAVEREELKEGRQ